MEMTKWKKCTIQSKIFLQRMEKVTQIPSQCENGTVWLEISHTETLLDHMDWEVEMLIEFCERNGLSTNTWFKKPKRRPYPWQLPRYRSLHLLE